MLSPAQRVVGEPAVLLEPVFPTAPCDGLASLRAGFAAGARIPGHPLPTSPFVVLEARLWSLSVLPTSKNCQLLSSVLRAYQFIGHQYTYSVQARR